ncbi:AAA family ATPase [uncultured Psychromonas sp.]|uniref:AAA family ATPase n=1 Tax=uncultured Psychromonas sp. TaxID=173974 RepID=UPI0026156672|nr:AAA family ATPase [uncultured Psychromonas sp.]
MTKTISPLTSSNASSKNDQISEQISPLTAQQCTTHFEAYLKQYKEIEKDELAELFPDAVSIVSHYLKLPTPLLLINSRHWLSAEQLLKQVIPDTYPTQYLLSFNQETLFGRISLMNDGELNFADGQLKKSNGGLLVLNISPLLVDPGLWFKLKSVLQRQHLLASDAVNAERIKQVLPDLSTQLITTKIILVASRLQLEELIQIDPEYTQVSSLFCELANQVPVSQKSVNAIVSYCHNLTQQLGLKSLQDEALATLLNFFSIQCEHQKQLLFSPELFKQVLQYANLFTDNKQITKLDLIAYFEEIDQAQSLARKYSEQSLLEGQVNLQLSGENIGQINGLAVVELLGYPCEFGEVFRISASDMIGDGEIIDVERKVELAGNIHAKSTLIVQGYLNHFFSHISAFPYSCNLVFEQSYQESDGDSASLAILLAVSSCYAQFPVKQNIFVTGSLDQHGNVLAIGGINQKIEAVARLFELGLLDDPISIVMPKANQINLTLNLNTLALVESGKINIHAVSHCHQAFPLLLGKSFEQVIKAINTRIEITAKEEMEETSAGLFSRLKDSIFH